MCSLSGDIEEMNLHDCTSAMKQPETKKSECQVCRKCGENSVIVLQKQDALCKSCFLTYCLHKFKATIGKTKIIKPVHKVLVACSGGVKSSTMLDMITQALHESSYKRLFFQIGVLFIDESSTVNCSPEKVNQTLENIYKKIENVQKCQLLCSSMEMIFRDNDADFYWKYPEQLTGKSSTDLKMRLTESLNSLTSLTSKLDYIECLRMHLMLDIASAENYTHVFVGDSASSLAVKFLSSIAAGRGSQVSHNTAFYDPQYKVPVCRPMREFLNKEITFYNHLSGVPYTTWPTLHTMGSPQSSIQRLTETFVNGLQDNFPDTVSTIFRTGGKIASTSSHCSDDDICVICKSFRDNISPDPCSALEALSLSTKLSKSINEKDVEVNRFQEFVCHGCQIVMDELGDGVSLPPLILQSIKRSSRSEMKEEIKEYLIHDEDGL